MEFIIFLAILLIACWVWSVKNQKEKQIKHNIYTLAQQANRHSKKMTEVTTTSARITNCRKALDCLYHASSIGGYEEVIENYDECVQKLEKQYKVFPMIAPLERASRLRYRGSKKSEINALLDAKYQAELNGVTDEDIVIADITPEGSEDYIFIHDIDCRLSELGHQGKIEPIADRSG